MALAEQPIGRAGRAPETFEKVLTGLPYIIAYALRDNPAEGETLDGLAHHPRGARLTGRGFNGSDLRVVLLPLLRWAPFSCNQPSNFEKIRRARAVLHNLDRRFPLDIASENSFGRKKGWVCLFGLRNCDDQTLEDTLDNKYCFRRPPWFVKYEPNSTI